MSYKAVLFGSIGTLAETSDLQRNAFNEAFKISGLDWFWDEDIYRKLLSKSGGTTRINDYAKDTSLEIDGKKIRNLKTKIFNEAEKPIGEVTSGTFGPSVNGPIAMGYIDKEFSKIDTKILLEVRGKKHSASICGLPFYKKSYVKGVN